MITIDSITYGYTIYVITNFKVDFGPPFSGYNDHFVQDKMT